ncbi:MAG: winged helix-turn-helix domain-containing protein [Acidobacteria bacterium]|nr:winged helix-turn-helix domain-containing protein [Acidobacteriota bacterium]
MPKESKGDTPRAELAIKQNCWNQAGELIELGEYEELAELLRQAQIRHEQKGNTLLAELLAATCQICLECTRLRAEMAWHRRAHEEATERESELKQQLYTIIDNIGHESVQPPQPKERVRTGAHELPNVPLTVQLQQEKKLGAVSLAFYCLGLFRVYRNDQAITHWSSLKGQSILKYLVSHQTTPISKDILMDVLWPDADPDSARRNLHQAIYSLRQTLRRSLPDYQAIQFENDCYRLNPELSLWFDFEEFKVHAQAGCRYESSGQWVEAATEYCLADELYRGDFLEEDLYEDWASLQREQLRHTYFDLADRLSEYYLRQGNYSATVAICQKILARDSCHEKAHCRLMRCYQTQGQRGLAVRQYQICVQMLKRELDVSPSDEVQALFEKITGGNKSFNLVMRPLS